ncbi:MULTISPECIES: hypothetical protein [Ciceribacter]|uniref:Uncharacterized protein n=1 Tax=Ciceribacter lividus TaxID=1197950 RepID=A0A6I7HT95_9HYPH|nr:MULTISPECIES: hypothetical protein [Ciceribacter]MCO6177620.1 hypothetical protein [Ciceribacter sp. RN22]RCW27534.1 hypothetical protein DFR48_10217 [Ciceribacter lividus]
MNVSFHPLRSFRRAVAQIGTAVHASEEYSLAQAGGDAERRAHRNVSPAILNIPL